MSITVSNITKTYGQQNALNNVSFGIKSGEIVGFLGPNGAGKSTMMKILTGYIPQTSGDAEVCGFDVSERIIDVQKRVGYLPEHNPLYLDMYVKEYLSFVAGTFKVSKTQVDEIIEKTGITPEKHKKLGALSKGYRQRVGLAAALIHNPEVLILDEPTTGLDPNQLVEIRNLIKELGREKTVILSSHIMQEIEEICSRVIIINKGNIVADKPIDELKSISSNSTVIVRFSEKVSLEEIKVLQTTITATLLENNTFRIETKESEPLKKELFQLAIKNNVVISEIKETEESLEGVFRSLTK